MKRGQQYKVDIDNNIEPLVLLTRGKKERSTSPMLKEKFYLQQLDLGSPV